MSNDDLAALPPKHVCPRLAGVHLTYVHSLGSRAGIAYHDRAAKPSVPGAVAYPPDASLVVKVVDLLAVRIELACKGDGRESTTTRRREWVLAFDAVQVTVPDAGVSSVSEEDQSVGKRLEPTLDGRLKGWIRLGVMVHDERLLGAVSTWR